VDYDEQDRVLWILGKLAKAGRVKTDGDIWYLYTDEVKAQETQERDRWQAYFNAKKAREETATKAAEALEELGLDSITCDLSRGEVCLSGDDVFKLIAMIQESK
jgi:hypothetical protein